MDFNTLMFKFNSIVTQLLSINGKGPSVSEKAVDSSSSSNFWSTLGIMLLNLLRDIGLSIYNVFATLIMLIMRLCLNFVDFLTFFIREFMGMSTAQSLTENSNFGESDIILKFLFSESVTKVLFSIFGLSLVLLIVFTIIAIIKNQWQSISGDEKPIGQIIAKTLRAVFVMIMAPVMIVFGIIFSNVVLVSIINTINRNNSTNMSIGSEIFVASSYNANQFRRYAENNQKIPMLFSFSGGFKNVEGLDIELPTEGSSSQINQEMQELKNSGVLKQGYEAAVMMQSEKFYNITSINNSNSYYKAYDGIVKTKQIEYYVMADFIDYAMRTGYNFYFKNVEEVYSSIHNANSYEIDVNQPQINQLLNTMSAYIGAYNDKGERVFDNANVATYKFDTLYNPKMVHNEPDIDFSGKYSYKSTEGTYDEIDGSKYVVCVAVPYRYYTNAGKTELSNQVAYVPLTKGSVVNGITFDSEYLQDESMFIARGLFTKDNLPTVIREQGDKIEFYRQNIDIPTILDFFPKIIYEEQDANDISLIEIITGFNPSTAIPKIIFRFDFLSAYTKKVSVENSLDSGIFNLNYNFSNKGVGINSVYNISEINYIILCFATVIVFIAFFSITIGLVGRVYELLLLYLTFPAFASAYPLDDGSRFRKWISNFVPRVFGAYSVFITFSLILMIFPIISNIDFFSVDMMMQNQTGFLTTQFGLSLMNFVTRILFTLVLFTMFKTMPNMIQELINANAGKNYSITGQGEGLIQSSKAMITKAANLTSGRVIATKLLAGKKKSSGGLVSELKAGHKGIRERRKIKKGFKRELKELKAEAPNNPTSDKKSMKKLTGDSDAPENNENA